MKRATLVLALAAVSLAACKPSTPGELSNGGFTYFCASDDDLACRNDLFGASDVPPAIAVGAHFDLQFTPPSFDDGVDTSVTRIAPASPSILSIEASLGTDTTGFRFAEEGTVAVLAEHGNQVIDFVHVTGARLDTIALVDRIGDEISALTLDNGALGDPVSALPRDASGHTLAGALKYAWASSDESVVSLAPGLDANEVNLIPHKAGTAMISVAVQDHQVSLPVTVGGAP